MNNFMLSMDQMIIAHSDKPTDTVIITSLYCFGFTTRSFTILVQSHCSH